ncbi:hypothetical protein BO78DRAFT_3901 [Aspergillus sclerotiicarbonarius CBS 121057]|uniref:Uncharacterized protein n=1 Tax=Aspergillus sclerotiicarbonarius (strain CBS 121057 / IBT 28362) TaxID=1448318 RepID=A0A319F374_ASPSB|nr:hypothetical protein BO78DRAFT_3901 [Aspergillus sclerotiicarbonarius CBS 121057]
MVGRRLSLFSLHAWHERAFRLMNPSQGLSPLGHCVFCPMILFPLPRLAGESDDNLDVGERLELRKYHMRFFLLAVSVTGEGAEGK